MSLSVGHNHDTHTHPFNGPFSGTTRVGRYQKGKTYLDFTEARDCECQWHQLGHMQVCTSLQTDNHASTSPLSFFTGLDALPAAQPTASKHWRRMVTTMSSIKITEPIEMPFRIWTWVESGNHVVGGGLDPTSRGKWAIWGTPPAMQAFRQNSLNTCLHRDREFCLATKMSSCLYDMIITVLSHNKITDIDVAMLSRLAKLQLSHNRLTTFPDVRVWNCLARK